MVHQFLIIHSKTMNMYFITNLPSRKLDYKCFRGVSVKYNAGDATEYNVALCSLCLMPM